MIPNYLAPPPPSRRELRCIVFALSVCLSVCVSLCVSVCVSGQYLDILFLGDIDLKFIQDTYRVVINLPNKNNFICQGHRDGTVYSHITKLSRRKITPEQCATFSM